MQLSRVGRSLGFCCIMLLVCVVSLSLVLPGAAQDGSFATNTPAGQSDANGQDAAPLFATNTPAAPILTNTGPEDSLFNYGLRFWLEPDFVNFVFEQIVLLETDDPDRQVAVNMLLYEMETRFPAAPADMTQRMQLIEAMLNAPVGSLDMRQILFPFFQESLTNNAGQFNFDVAGFNFSLIPTNLDGNGGLDRLIHITYERDDIMHYEEYLLATANESGSYDLLEPTYDLPAVPFGDVKSIRVENLQDVNGDTLDELVLRVDDGQASDRFFIIEYRNGRAVDLVDPTLELRVGQVVDWNLTGTVAGASPLTVLEFQTISAYPDWQCIEEIEYTWRFERNLYRRSVDLNEAFENIPSLGCTLRQADLFSLAPADAITTVESALLDYTFEAPSANRALMTLSMLYVLTGRLDDARNTAQSVITVDDDTTWEAQQAQALISAANASGNTALNICESLAQASEFPACDMNAVLGRFLDGLDLNTTDDLITQLENVGLPVLQNTVVSTAGRADRIVILFGLTNTDWWGFYDGRDGTYNVEPATAPPNFAALTFPESPSDVPQSAYDALLIDNEPSRTLTIINNTLSNTDVPLQPSGLYLQALAYEFTGDRNTARAIYYQIWETYAGTIWGTLAAEHLELR